MLATKLSCFEPYVTHKKSVFPFLCLKYAACSFIAGKTCFALFAVKLGCFQCNCTGKRLSASLQRVTLILLDFTQNYAFVCFLLREAVFSIMFLRAGFSFFSKLNFAFDPLSYGKHVLVCWQRNWKLRTLCQKKQRFSFSQENTLPQASEYRKYVLVSWHEEWVL